jgi:eukaryotic-like serine/threonine-protein kinase
MRLGDDRYLGSGEPEVMPDAMIGTRVGPFAILRPLGEGGMGKVYLAEHTVLKTRRAVKVLSPQLTQNELLVRRFINEARAAARLHHRNLIQVHDVGQLPGGAWFMVLDYLDGNTLGRTMAAHAGPMPMREIVSIVCEIANGLQVAHDHKIVHRDLKPENVFLAGREGDPRRAVVLDFGVAQLGDDPDAGPDTRSGVALGTPAYMSPEQLRGGKVTPAADVFALGVMVYQMSTGGWFPYQHGESRLGYGGLSAAEQYHRQMTGPPVDPRERCTGLADAWAAAILAAIALEPAARPASARAFAVALAEAAGQPSAPDTGARYQLGERLGIGGMAEVFMGTMIGVEGFARQVAIKRVLTGLSQVPAFAAMFITEARLAAQLAHPNIVSVLDFSRDVEARLFLVMEYVAGKDLASLLDTGPIPTSLAIFIIIELLRGLGYAHDLTEPATGTRGVIHRDVSPQNLLLGYEGAVKVSDFGLAKARAAGDGVWSETVRGKPSYMSPEQIAGEVLDGRTDLYAVGVMLWEMLAHRPLFAGTTNEILSQAMFREVALPSSFRGDVPRDVEAVAMTLLRRDRNDRYPTAEAAIDALLCCRDVPRDGRGQLVHLLAARFPRASGARPQRGVCAAPYAPRAQRPAQITVAAPPSGIAPAAAPVIRATRRARRRALARPVLGGLVVAALAIVAMFVRGDSAPPDARAVGPYMHAPVTVSPAVPRPAAPEIVSVPSAPAPAGPEAARAPGAGRGASPSPAVSAAAPGAVASAARTGERAPARPPPAHHDRARVARTGELAIIVTPWAMIWLNGKPSGQTPFRAPVPAGVYHVRLVNDDLDQDQTMSVTVEPDQTATVERTW